MTLFSGYEIIPIINASSKDELDEKLDILKKNNHKIVEIVLRKDNSLELLQHALDNYKDFTVGVGTVYEIPTLKKVSDMGVSFIMSPGNSLELIRYAKDNGINFIPAAITPQEIVTLIENGYKLIKVFPISNFGGTKYVKVIDELFGQRGVKFVPSGGVNISNIKEYLKFESVVACCSSSFVDELS